MQRRKFFRNMGLGLGSGLLAPHLLACAPPMAKEGYSGIRALSDATNVDGELALRLAFVPVGERATSLPKVRIKISKKGRLKRTKSYFLEPPDKWLPEQGIGNMQLKPNDSDIIVVWIENADESTTVTISTGREPLRFTLGALLEKGELHWEKQDMISVNFLGYLEIGELDTAGLGIQNQQRFRFAVMADPQGGDPNAPNNEAPTRIKIHNAFIGETVERINELEPPPTFTLVLGDFIDSKGQPENFLEMEKLIKPLKMPVLLGVGNHETPYDADFSPGYNMAPLDHFFDSQRRVNGIDKILYSFNLGQWHFVVWPDPLRPNFWATHPHYFDWLETDLSKHRDRPTVFLQHVPLHPIGIDPLTSYVESVSVKKLLVDILAEHGNVKYILSGHVHIPLKASVKTAVSYCGMNMINLPAAGYRPRAFGEPDFFGGPEQGVCVIDVNEEALTVHYQHITKEWFTYPKSFPEFDDKKFPLWFKQPWQLPLQDTIANGDFAEGLRNWHERFVYTEDENPSNIREVRKGPGNKNALYLYSRKRDYDVPGQDRVPQHINRVFQAVSLKGRKNPRLIVHYHLDENHYDPESLNGFFIWLEIYNSSENVANLIYSAGKIYAGLTKGFGKGSNSPDYHLDLPSKTGKWHTASLAIGKDYSMANEKNRIFDALYADRVVIHLGTWTVNEGMGQEAGVFIDNINIEEGLDEGSEAILKSEKDIWYRKNKHIAGDHQYTDQSAVYPEGLRGNGEAYTKFSDG